MASEMTSKIASDVARICRLYLDEWGAQSLVASQDPEPVGVPPIVKKRGVPPVVASLAKDLAAVTTGVSFVEV